LNSVDEIVIIGVDVATYRFGPATLHAWIRFFECLFHISRRLEIKKWQARGKNQRNLQNKNKNSRALKQ